MLAWPPAAEPQQRELQRRWLALACASCSCPSSRASCPCARPPRVRAWLMRGLVRGRGGRGGGCACHLLPLALLVLACPLRGRADCSRMGEAGGAEGSAAPPRWALPHRDQSGLQLFAGVVWCIDSHTRVVWYLSELCVDAVRYSPSHSAVKTERGAGPKPAGAWCGTGLGSVCLVLPDIVVFGSCSPLRCILFLLSRAS